MSTPKLHHYVPQMLLRRFTDDRGRLYIFNKRCPDKGILHLTPRQAFAENHLYTMRDLDGSKNYSLEYTLARIEEVADRIIEKLICQARSSLHPSLTRQEKVDWDLFFGSQVMRVPDVHQSEDSIDATLRQLANRMSKSDDMPPAAVQALDRLTSSDEMMSDMRQNARSSLAIPTKSLLDVLGNKGVGVIRIKRTKSSFVIGSMPVVKLTHKGRTHLSDPTVEAWLPIAPDVAITPAFTPGTAELIELTDILQVRHINQASFKQSTAIAGRSRRLIVSLARGEIAASN